MCKHRECWGFFEEYISTMRGIDKFHKLSDRGISHMWGCTM